MDIAAAWYTSGTFWAGAGVVVAAVAIAATAWVTLAVAFPRRRLYYGLRAEAARLAAPDGMRSDLELRHRGTLLADPHVLTIELVGRGRRDITSDDFHDHQPLRLNVGARIVEILQATSEPETLEAPPVTVDGTALDIGPGLIGGRHKITITVLTDGGHPDLTCKSHLINIQIVRRGADELSLRRARVALTVPVFAMAVTGAVVMAATARAVPVQVASMAAVMVVAAVSVALATVMLARR